MRIISAFYPRRSAILLIGGNKASDDRFYERMIPLADRHRPFKQLTKGFSQVRVADKTAALETALALHDLRKARAVSQEQLAAKLAVGQPAVAKLERRADMYVSNLRRYIEVLGGTLEITARFPDGAVTIAAVGEADTERE